MLTECHYTRRWDHINICNSPWAINTWTVCINRWNKNGLILIVSLLDDKSRGEKKLDMIFVNHADELEYIFIFPYVIHINILSYFQYMQVLIANWKNMVYKQIITFILFRVY